MMHDEVQAWLDAYIAAWRGYDPDAIADLFTENATYAYQPWATPVRGRKAIVDGWLSNQDEPGSWKAEYRPLFVHGNQAVVVGDTWYENERDFANLFLLTFDDDGRCATFVEWYMPKPMDD
jgi:ketosteroid isomerase-like protein